MTRDQVLKEMSHNPLGNYIIPGVTSWLLADGSHGKVRIFDASRNAHDFVTPHSHRFNFTAMVLRGKVRNTLYRQFPAGATILSGKPTDFMSNQPEQWGMSTITQVCGADGVEDYVHERATEPTSWTAATTEYKANDWYSMRWDEIHSIKFARDTSVLFFEGPQVVAQSVMLEPWVNGKIVPTFKVEPWMFEKLEGA